ncbi:PH domain-containing protein [Shewanella donghaensis]|uniref:PH domain-containing protein n=1 Tax=Shewanella donghaensis TaxID=238836 RepID=UPI001182C58A|nr:PH domain-containing protein [Shewanella donghaensis]
MIEVELAGLTSNGVFSFLGMLLGLLALSAFIWFKKLPSNALYVSFGIILFLFMLFLWTLYKTTNSQLSITQVDTQQASSSVSPQVPEVTLSIPLYSQQLHASEVLWQQAQFIDVSIDSEFAPQWRTNGIGLPGYSLGWFTLKNGDKALISLTRREALMLPTNKGYTLLLTVEDKRAAMKMIAAMK